MKVGVNNYFGYVKIVGKSKIEQSGGESSARLVLDGMIEKKHKRGTVVAIRKIHVPIVAYGRLAQSLDVIVGINDYIWVIGEMDENVYFDEYNVQQRRNVINLNYFTKNKQLDIQINELFKAE